MRKELDSAEGGVMIWNPTNENMDMQYCGISFTVHAGEKRAFNSNCANYILNSYGQRGITSLKYGDESREKEIGEKAIERNYEFKKRQVVGYNLQNENRKHMNLGYLPPSGIIKKYAIELGVKLLEPFSVRDEEREAIARTSVENEKLKIQIEEMQKQHMAEMTEFKQMMQKLIEKDEEPKRKGNPNWVKKTE